MERSLDPRVSMALVACVLSWAAGCATTGPELRVTAAVARGAYADALREYENDGSQRAVLRTFAETMLLLDAQSPDVKRQHAAFNELGMLGTRARPLLDQLARAERPKRIRVRASALLWRLGDSSARETLRELAADPDTDVADQAFVAFDLDDDCAEVLAALRAPRSARRLSALTVIARAAAQDRRDISELLEVTRLDPEPSVRAAALYALDPRAPSSISAFERALSDQAESVRIAAQEAFARAAPERVTPYLDRQLGAALTRETLAAAAVLLRLEPAREPVRAHDVLARGLSATEPSMRGYAAVLLRTLPEAQQDRASVRARVAVEASADVKFGLAMVLGADDPVARTALAALAQGNSLPAAQAAGELSRHGDAAARTRLLALRASPSNVTRAGVARELRAPELTAALLTDADAAVRLAAAGAVLRGLFGA